MKQFIKIILAIILFHSCNNENNSNAKFDIRSENETSYMVSLLKALNDTGNPAVYFHWNKKLANIYKELMQNAPNEKRLQFWFLYCTQLLNAGENQQCINEIESFIQKQNSSYENILNSGPIELIELLAIAYLRLGEMENCHKNHNAFSCILPIVDKAFHIDKIGSQKAIELYSMLQKKQPKDKYKWLLNLAHMTLGDYPHNVPKDYFIQYPNWEKEKNDFPAFKEIASGLGIGQTGLSGGVCVDDFNNDGFIDIFSTSYGMMDQCKLFLNTGSGFTDHTIKAGLKGIVSGLNCIHADYNNDGNKDILILRGAWLGAGGKHPNSLLKNNGDGTFEDVTKSSGLLSFHPTQTAAWADVNRDGYLDLFIGNESKGSQIHPCELFINQKNGTFVEQSAKFNLGGITGFVKGVSFGDINNDQYPDLFISVLEGKNILFKNENGTFKNISKTAGVEEPLHSFPCWFWDVNNDGFEDIFVNSYDVTDLKNLSGDFASQLQGKEVTTAKSKLFINNGNETFREESKSYQLDMGMYTMGANFGDLDNDGFLDFYIGTGAPDFTSVIPNRMFKNINGTHFDEVTSAGRFGHIQKGHGVGFADFDNDGDQDIYAVIGGAYEGDNYPNIYFENPISDNNWIVLELQGTISNRSAIGTNLKLELDNGNIIYHSVNTGGSFGANSLQAELGLGQSVRIKTLTIKWPNGNTQIINNITGNKKYQLIEGQSSLVEMKYLKFEMKINDHIHHH